MIYHNNLENGLHIQNFNALVFFNSYKIMQKIY